MKRYTKADLEEIIYLQLANLNAMGDLIRTMKLQNELIEKANAKLKSDVVEFRRRVRYRSDLNLGN